MICIGISKNTLEECAIFEGYFSVFTDEASLYFQAYEVTTTVVIITDDFVEKIVGWDRITDVVSSILKVKPQLTIVMLGTALPLTIRGTIALNMDWKLPERVNRVLERVHNLKKQGTSSLFNLSFDELLINLGDPSSFAAYVMKNPRQSLDVLREVFNYYNHGSKELMAKESRISKMMLDMKTLNATLESKDEKLVSLSQAYEELYYIYSDLIFKINKQYMIPYEEQGALGFVVNNSRYQRILYIKELSSVRYTTTLFYYLHCLLNTLHSGHTRAMVIEKPGFYKSAFKYPYYVMESELTTGAVKNSDLVLTGYKKDVINAVLQNVVSNKFLVVLDRTGADNEFLVGDKVKTVYMMNDINDNRFYGKSKKDIISYSHSSLYVPYIEEFDRMDVSKKLTQYSDLPVMRRLLECVEGEI